MTNPEKNLKKNSRRRLFDLHRWVGFHLAFIMTLVLATGTIATVSYEIDWLIQDDMRVSPGEKKVSWQTMTDAVRAYAPNSSILDIKNMEADYFAYRAVVKDQFGQKYNIHINQWTGEITGTTSTKTVQQFFRDLHRNFFTPNIIGIPIVCSMGIVLLISLYTGLKTSRNWKKLMTRVRVNNGSRAFISDAHKAAGLWGIWFVLLISITGIWYFIELSAQVTAVVSKNQNIAFGLSRPNLSEDSVRSFELVIPQRSTDDIIEATHRAFPEITVSRIFFPSRPNQAIRVFGTRNNPILRPRSNQVLLDPVSLEPVIIHRSEELPWVSWLNEIADPLHYGFFGGLITKLIWFVFGIALTGLSITGVVLTWRRLRTKSITRMQFFTLPVLIVSLYLSFVFINKKAPTPTISEHVLRYKGDVPLDIALHLEETANQQFNGKVRMLVTGDNGIANVKDITIELQKNQQTSSSQKLKLQNFAKTSVYQGTFAPEKLNAAHEFIATLNLNNEEKIIASWPVKLRTFEQ